MTEATVEFTGKRKRNWAPYILLIPSALFLLTSDVTVDKVQDAFADTQMVLIRSNLTQEQEAKMLEDFGE